MSLEDNKAELAKRQTQLKARKGKSGWGQNVSDLEDRIAELEQLIAAEEE